MVESPQRHHGKIALVSGAARGQGREIALRLAREGADVAMFDLCDRPSTSQYAGSTESELSETAAMVQALGRQAMTAVADCRDRGAVDAFVAQVIDNATKIDIVCANAGLVTWVPFLEMSAQQWSEVIDINLTGVFNTLQPVLKHMVDRLSGVAVLTGSCNSIEPGDSIAHYTASKHGVLGLAKNLALEMGPYGIRVNAILPSTVNTVMGNNPTNLKWIFGRDDATEADYLSATRQWHALRNTPALPPSAIADSVSWLCSDDAKYITGGAFAVDGGHLILPGFNHRPISE